MLKSRLLSSFPNQIVASICRCLFNFIKNRNFDILKITLKSNTSQLFGKGGFLFQSGDWRMEQAGTLAQHSQKTNKWSIHRTSKKHVVLTKKSNKISFFLKGDFWVHESYGFLFGESALYYSISLSIVRKLSNRLDFQHTTDKQCP